MTTTGFSTHDHTMCIATAIKSAEDHCATAKVQLTPVRRRVLEILLAHHKAMGAYDILNILREEGLGSQPPVAYRALDFLVTQGFVHRIENQNAFVACTHPGTDHEPAFLICTDCKTVAEMDAKLDQGPLSNAAHRAGFTVQNAIVEALGQCPSCAKPS